MPQHVFDVNIKCSYPSYAITVYLSFITNTCRQCKFILCLVSKKTSKIFSLRISPHHFWFVASDATSFFFNLCALVRV